jgi:hypothetical protein
MSRCALVHRGTAGRVNHLSKPWGQISGHTPGHQEQCYGTRKKGLW